MALLQTRRNFLKRLVYLIGLVGSQGVLLSGCSDTPTGVQPASGIETAPLSNSPDTPKAGSSAAAPLKTPPSEMLKTDGPSSQESTLDVPTGYERVGPVENFKPADDPHGVTIRGKNVVVYNSGSSFYVFSDFCTHQGCQVEYSARPQKFICPCHGSEFSKTGEVVKGPALTSLTRFEFKIVRAIVYANLTHL